MKQDFILGKLSEIMRWDTESARSEFGWLRLMSRIKYDGYQDFLAGARFIESLADWLQQFELEDRAAAYGFVRNHLVYIGQPEMSHLVSLFYPDTVQWRLMQAVASRLSIPTYRVWAEPEAIRCFETLLRKTLFIELSDGARIDLFRRANALTISNEQIVTAPRIIQAKWDSLLEDLRSDLGDAEARFAFVFLVDDFVGSGLTLLRKKDSVWKGKLLRFWDDLQNVNVIGSHLEPTWVLCVHHYIATHQATRAVLERHRQASEERGDQWFSFQSVQFSYGVILPEDFPVDAVRHRDFLRLVEEYYDDSVENRHTEVGGKDVRFGFGGCKLPLVLEHNTPNNSLALLWAETLGGANKRAMRPLFRRRQRHS